MAQLGVARFAQKYPAVRDTLLRALLELICKYTRTIIGYGCCAGASPRWGTGFSSGRKLGLTHEIATSMLYVQSRFARSYRPGFEGNDRALCEDHQRSCGGKAWG